MKEAELYQSLMEGMTISDFVNKSPAFQLYVEKFLVGTINMSSGEVGAYFLLLCHQWDLFGLENNNDELMELGRCNEDTLMKILKKFRKCPDGKYRNPKLEKIRAEQIYKHFTKSNSGKLGNEIRWGKKQELKPTMTKKPLIVETPSTGDFFYIGIEIYKIPISKYIQGHMSIFLDAWKMKNSIMKDKLDDIFKKMDAENVGHQYTSEQHIQNTFKKIAREMFIPVKKQQPGTEVKASIPTRVKLD